MDPTTIKTSPYFAEAFQHIRRMGEKSVQKKDQCPQDMPPTLVLMEKFKWERESGLEVDARLHAMLGADLHRIQLTFVPHLYLPCTEPLEELTPMFISELLLETRHRGRKLTFRVYNQPNRIHCVSAVIGDQVDNAALLQLHHLPQESMMPAEEVMWDGRVGVFKEPYFKTTLNGSYALSVHHVSDLVWLEECDERIPMFFRKDRYTEDGMSEVLRKQGNAAVESKQWAKAARLYSSAESHAETKKEAQLARLNRSWANLNLGHFEDALADASGQEGEHVEKGLFREARALYELGRYEESVKKTEEISTAFPSNVAINPHMDRCQTRLGEARDGKYDFARMYMQASRKNPIVDCATFSKPVEVRPSQGKDRGLFTTQAVSAGELLLCEKDFVYRYAGPDNAAGGKTSILLQAQGKPGFIGVPVQLVSDIVQKLQHNAQSSQGFLDLHHGEYETASVREVDGRPVVDTFLALSTMISNSFGSPRTSLSKFKEVLSANSVTQDAPPSTEGIWTKASYINHSCIGNCTRAFIGDVQIIRATRDLPKGTELVFPYKEPLPNSSYEDAQRQLRSWGFKCDCALCVDLKATSDETLATRTDYAAKLFGLIETSQNRSTVNVNLAGTALGAIDTTYTTPIRKQSAGALNLTPRLVLIGPCLALANLLLQRGQLNEAVIKTVKCLEAFGFDIIAPLPSPPQNNKARDKLFIRSWGMFSDYVPTLIRFLFLAYHRTRPELAAAAKRYLITAYGMAVGETETVYETFQELK